MKTVQEMKDAGAAAGVARRKYYQAVASVCKEGVTVFWYHGDNERQGRVIRTSDERVCVESPAGKRYWVNAHGITQAKP